MPKPTNQRVAEYRARKRKGGLVRFEAYVTPEQARYLKAKVEKMQKP